MTTPTCKDCSDAFCQSFDGLCDKFKPKSSYLEKEITSLRADLAAREAEISGLEGDSLHLQACIAEFERLKSAVMNDAKIPVMLRVRDSLYLDGVLAVLTTRKAPEGAKP